MKSLSATKWILIGVSIIGVSSALYFIGRGEEKSRIEK